LRELFTAPCQADGDTAMTRGKGEIIRADLSSADARITWRYPAEMARRLKNGEVLFGAVATLSAAHDVFFASR
jgi:hypothetical protein